MNYDPEYDCPSALIHEAGRVPCQNGRGCKGPHDNADALGHHITWTSHPFEVTAA